MNEWVGERPSFWILSGQSLFSVSNPNQIDPAENNEYIDGSSAVSIHTSLQGDAPPVLLVDMYVYIYIESYYDITTDMSTMHSILQRRFNTPT